MSKRHEVLLAKCVEENVTLRERIEALEAFVSAFVSAYDAWAAQGTLSTRGRLRKLREEIRGKG